MYKTLFSNELKKALEDIKNNFTPNKDTAKRSALKQTTIDQVKKAFFELKRNIETTISEIELDQSKISFGMGRYQVAGHFFPHIWGAYYPDECGKPSSTCPQLFIARKDDYIRWGISLSDLGNEDLAQANAITEFYEINKASFETFEGFKFENDSKLRGQFKTSFNKEVKIANIIDIDSIGQNIKRDFEALFPHFKKLVTLFREKNLLRSASESEEDVEIDEINENIAPVVSDDSNFSHEPFTMADAESDIFFEMSTFKDMCESLKQKKNILLQGPPGVGKTFVAKLLAYSMIGSKNKDRVDYVQFHQSYSYEDFIQGYRPGNNGFVRKDGVFMDACRKARAHGQAHFLIIDEINRGNLSKIFGELLMLIEADKREMEISLTYSQSGEKFFVPKNLYIIGTMNTADRSLSVVDYALRRRFAFFNMKPEIESVRFESHLRNSGILETEIKKIQKTINKLNIQIRSDKRNLGQGFEIGHSYFCYKPSDVPFEVWFEKILKHEIYPLMKEYWFDDQDKVEAIIEELKAA